jgi:hypothetical protein
LLFLFTFLPPYLLISFIYDYIISSLVYPSRDIHSSLTSVLYNRYWGSYYWTVTPKEEKDCTRGEKGKGEKGENLYRAERKNDVPGTCGYCL